MFRSADVRNIMKYLARIKFRTHGESVRNRGSRTCAGTVCPASVSKVEAWEVGSVRNGRLVEQSVTLCVDGARNGAASMCCNSGKLQDVWTDLGQNQEKCSKQALCGTSFVILCASNQGEKGKKCSKQAVCGTSFVNPRASNQGEKGKSVQNRQFAEHFATLCCMSRRCSKPEVSGTWCGTVRQKVKGSGKEKR